MLPLRPNDWVNTASHFLNTCLFFRQARFVIIAKRGDLEPSLLALGVEDGTRVTSISTVNAQAVEEDGRYS